MDIQLNKFPSGWVGMSLTLTDEDINKLVSRLTSLQNGKCGHFHIRRDDLSGEPSVADIEISLDNNDSGTMNIE